MTLLLDGKTLSENIREEISKRVKAITSKGYREPTLAVVLVGNDPASHIYVRNKRKACQKVGIRSLFYHLPENTTTPELLDLIAYLNSEEKVDGILVQLPLPAHISQQEVILSISPRKDVDGFHPENMGKLVARIEGGVYSLHTPWCRPTFKTLPYRPKRKGCGDSGCWFYSRQTFSAFNALERCNGLCVSHTHKRYNSIH